MSGTNIANFILFLYLWKYFQLPWVIFAVAFMAGMICNLITIVVQERAKKP